MTRKKLKEKKKLNWKFQWDKKNSIYGFDFMSIRLGAEMKGIILSNFQVTYPIGQFLPENKKGRATSRGSEPTAQALG